MCWADSQTGEVPLSASHKFRRVLVWVLVVVLLAALGLVVAGNLRSLPQVFRGKLVDFLPMKEEVPGWLMKLQPVADTPEMKKAVVDALNYDDAALVDFTAKDLLRVSVYAAYWAPGKMPHRLVAGHTPDVCWVGGGWKCLERGVENVAVAGEATHVLPMEHRVFRLGDQTEHVVFCHLVGGRVMSYGSAGRPPWYAFLSDLVGRGLRQREEQFFVRISSNRPVEEFKNTPPVGIFLQRLMAIQPASVH